MNDQISRITHPSSQNELSGCVYGFLGVLIFSLTLPAPRIAVSGFAPVFVGFGRAIVAAGLPSVWHWKSELKAGLHHEF